MVFNEKARTYSILRRNLTLKSYRLVTLLTKTNRDITTRRACAILTQIAENPVFTKREKLHEYLVQHEYIKPSRVTRREKSRESNFQHEFMHRSHTEARIKSRFLFSAMSLLE